MTDRTIDDVLSAHTDSLRARPGVVGTAIGLCDGRPCIRVFVRDSAAAQAGGIPRVIEGFDVKVEVTGPFRAR